MLNNTNSAMIKYSVGRISDSVIRQDHAIYWIYNEFNNKSVINSIFLYYKEYFTHPPPFLHFLLVGYTALTQSTMSLSKQKYFVVAYSRNTLLRCFFYALSFDG